MMLGYHEGGGVLVVKLNWAGMLEVPWSFYQSVSLSESGLRIAAIIHIPLD
jgi:hypothetical protein